MNPESDTMKIKGTFLFEHFNKDGTLLRSELFENAIANVGKNYALEAIFRSGAQIGTWYLGIIDNASWSAVAAADTMASHAGWIEFTGYSQSVRQTVVFAAASSQQVTNAASVATFSINTNGAIRGLFTTSVNTKGGSTGTLWNAKEFAGGAAVVTSGDSVRFTFTVSM